jgi:hypothetical protein
MNLFASLGHPAVIIINFEMFKHKNLSRVKGAFKVIFGQFIVDKRWISGSGVGRI